MTRPGQISLAHFCTVVFLVALALGLLCQAAVLWHEAWAHEFVMSPLLYGAFAVLVVAIDRLRCWMLPNEPQ